MSKGSSLKIIAALKKKLFRPILVFTFGSFKVLRVTLTNVNDVQCYVNEHHLGTVSEQDAPHSLAPNRPLTIDSLHSTRVLYHRAIQDPLSPCDLAHTLVGPSAKYSTTV